MSPFDFFSQSENAELATLLVASPLSDDERNGWLQLLPLLTSEEKKVLKKNLQEEITDFLELEKMYFEKLYDRISALAPAK